MRRVSERSAALGLYVVVAILYVLRLPQAWRIVEYNAFNGPLVVATPLGESGLAGLALAIAARISSFAMSCYDTSAARAPLEPAECVPGRSCSADPVFQFHFNRIEQKRMLRMSVREFRSSAGQRRKGRAW